eukprot:Tbor_TRINITY_DN5618_c1_g3::TRINITY_DN5618_c1_g3_i2::g.8470::m.8470
MEHTFRIASAFVVNFYRDFSSSDIPTITRMYADSSCISFSDFEVESRCYKGKNDIHEYYSHVREMLGPMKVSVRNADYVAAGDNISVTCSGQINSHMCRRVFAQTFVLTPTPNRENCYFISGETLRFLTKEIEEVPEGYELVSLKEYNIRTAAPPVVVDECEEEEQEVVPPAPVPVPVPVATIASTPKPQRERRERRERPPRKEKEVHRQNGNVNGNVNGNAVAADEVPAAAPTPAPPAPAARMPPSGPNHARKTHTNSVIILNIPRRFKLAELAEACRHTGEVVSANWWDKSSCVVEFAKLVSARDMVRQSGKFKQTDKYPGLKIEYYYGPIKNNKSQNGYTHSE